MLLIRFVFFAALIAGCVAAFRWWRRQQAAAMPALPDAWRDVAVRDPHMAEAVALRDKLAALSSDPQHGLGRDLILDVDSVIGGIADLVATRQRIETQLATLDDGSLDGAIEHLDVLRARPAALSAEVQRAITELREMVLELIDTSATASTPAEPGARVRRRLDGLRTRVDAEREIRADLDRS